MFEGREEDRPDTAVYDIHANGERAFLESLREFYLHQTERLHLFDVGANQGDYTHLLKTLFSTQQKTIHVFEPTRFSFLRLQQRFGHDKETMLHPKAVSNQEGRLEIYYDYEGSGLTSLYKRDLSAYGVSLEQSESVDAICLESYISEHRIEHIHFIKVDVEGHERSVLQGLRNRLHHDFIDFLQFEYGGTYLDSHTTLEDVYRLLVRSGFRVGVLLPDGLYMKAYHREMEDFQYANYVAVSNRIVEEFTELTRWGLK